jgi:hypothetical protein
MLAKIIKARLKTTADAVLLEEQQGFGRGKSTADDVFTLQQLWKDGPNSTWKYI